jgi:2-polyprenyl-6-methoxyphenol hydroxylase-like FAD-dependent oxidoreductase
VGGFLHVHTLPEPLRKSLEREPVTMTFGPHGFFGYAVSTPRSAEADKQQMMWWSTWEADPAPDRHALLADLRAQLLEHHDFWKSPHDSPDAPIFPTIISLGCGTESDTPSTMTAAEKNVLVLPRRITPRLPGWSSASGKIIIMGDAAHAMPPDSGQGVSCAAEDAVSIALFLKHFLAQGEAKDLDLDVALKNTARSYEDLRMKRLAFILNAAKHAGNGKRKLKRWQEILRDSFMWLFSTWLSSLLISAFLMVT